MDTHERRHKLAEARNQVASAIFSVLFEARANGECLTTVEVARRLEGTDYYDTLRDTLRAMKETGFVEDLNEDGGYRQWVLPDWMPPELPACQGRG